MDIGESLVGSYFKYVENCKIVVYNCQLEEEQGEIDVIALDQAGERVYLCEVATHLRGMLYGNGNNATLARVEHKIRRALRFAAQNFPERKSIFMLWSPVVSRGLAGGFARLASSFADQGAEVQFIINKEYTARIRRLMEVARQNIKITDEPAFRLLQILEHLR
ncbi:MAG: hypothetical protein IMW96_03020 [Thermoanaerobacteraceae bacterium]|nr:hypothetical protein [Thermoanaerobacteraceae bacterium]